MKSGYTKVINELSYLLAYKSFSYRGRNARKNMHVSCMCTHPTPAVILHGWFRGSAVERWSLSGELSLSCA